MIWMETVSRSNARRGFFALFCCQWGGRWAWVYGEGLQERLWDGQGDAFWFYPLTGASRLLWCPQGFLQKGRWGTEQRGRPWGVRGRMDLRSPFRSAAARRGESSWDWPQDLSNPLLHLLKWSLHGSFPAPRCSISSRKDVHTDTVHWIVKLNFIFFS